MAALDNFKNALVLLAIVAFFAAIAALTLEEFKGDVQKKLDRETVINESMTIDNATELSQRLDTRIVEIVYNSSGADWTTMHSAMYVLEDNLLKFYAPNVTGNKSKITYTFSIEDVAYNTSFVGLHGVTNSSDYFDTIGVIIAVMALIGLVVGAFAMVQR